MGKRGDLSQRDNANYYEQLARGLNLRTNQIRVQPNPKHENSRAQCNYILRNHPDFKVNAKKCPNTARDFKQLSCDAAGNIIKKNRNIITQLADHGDAVRYAFNTFLGDWYITHLKKSKYKTLPLQ
jgi:hypothetical protein